jgi:hypothetical protein
MIDDQVLEEPEDEEEEEEGSPEEELSSELERLIEVLLPPIGEEDIERLKQDLKPPVSYRDEMIEKIAAAIERGKARQNQNESID